MKLTKRQLDALQESIYHWYENLYLALAGMDLYENDSTCRLCDVYAENLCSACPIYMHTGYTDCGGTPYYTVSHLAPTVPSVIAEIHFLESLDTE